MNDKIKVNEKEQRTNRTWITVLCFLLEKYLEFCGFIFQSPHVCPALT